MSSINKPSPSPARKDWHYDTYYLSQRARLNTNSPTKTNNSQAKAKSKPKDSGSDPIAAHSSKHNAKPEVDKEAVIQKMLELADSVGVYLKIIENYKPYYS